MQQSWKGRRPQKEGDWIPVQSVSASSEISRHMSASNLISGAAMSGKSGKQDTHHGDEEGTTMWLGEADKNSPLSLEFDFGATYPLGEMWIWNYNQSHPKVGGLVRRGLRKIRLYSSIDRINWIELQGEGFPYELAMADGTDKQSATNLADGAQPIHWNHTLARYVRITANLDDKGHWGGWQEGERFAGLSQVRFYAGRGLACEPAEEWTALFHRRSGWTGADGIYSIPVDGNEEHGSAEGGKTVFVFGDTFIGEVDPATNSRLQVTMINNTLALLQGEKPDPDSTRFIWDDSNEDEPDSAILPTTPEALKVEGAYYWLQDAACVNGRFYCFPLIIGPNPQGREGFQFQVHGVTVVSAPMTEEGPNLTQQQQQDTAWFGRTETGSLYYYGAAVFPNTEEAKAPEADGFVYVYGLHGNDQLKQGIAARVPADHIENLQQWRFWDGQQWVNDPAAAQTISGETSSEYSISPVSGLGADGKYALVYLRFSGTPAIGVYFADSPVGPFEDPVFVYGCPEIQDNNENLILYNAKAHPHLSKPGELLISYNVNTTVMDEHIRYGDLYRPRFVNLRYIGCE